MTNRPGGNLYGTGFFVTRDWVLTAAHVVLDTVAPAVVYRGREWPTEVLVRLPADATETYALPDVALLRVGTAEEPIPDHDCIGLTELPLTEGDELFALGWPLVDHRPMLESMRLEYAGFREPVNSPRLLVTRGSQVQQGASGAAAIHLDKGGVVGIVKLSRGVDWDAGAVVVPTGVILSAFPASFGLLEKNREASASVNSREALEKRLGLVLARIEDTLSDMPPSSRKSLLRTLEGGYGTTISAEDLAVKLLGLPLERLRDLLKQLVLRTKDAAPAKRLHHDAACCAWVGDQPWVTPDGAARLADVHKSAEPWIVHLPCTKERTWEMYVLRASSERDWGVVKLAGLDAGNDPGTTLPEQLFHAVRAELLQNLCFIDTSDKEAVRKTWRKRRDEALAEARGLLLILPAGTAELDADLLRGLRHEFPGCTFAIFAPSLTPALGKLRELAILPTALSSEREKLAARLYKETVYQLENVAARP
ncbi:S1 family peptidase [Kitasatospora sp. NPDC094028]